MEKIRKILECSICLSVIHNPKQLTCDHSFCKSCLDKILVFKPDGSASIKCPIGCETETTISSTQTTNDLHNNFMLKNVVELAVEEDSPNDDVKGKCSSLSCSKNAIKYCWRCQRFRCADCYDAHNDADEYPDSITSVDFCSRADRQGVVYWREHLTESEYLCCERNYLCTYCKHRSAHSKHQYQLLTNVEKSLKDLMLKNIDANLDFATRKSNAKIEVNVAEDALAQKLRRRKIECLTEFSSYLDKEEENIKESFCRIKTEYTTAFNSVDYFKDCLLKDKFDIMIEKGSIVEKLQSVSFRGNNGIPGVAVSLDDGTIGGAYPLGFLKAAYCSNDSCKNFTCKFNDHPIECSLESVQLLNYKLTDFVKKETDDVAGGIMNEEKEVEIGLVMEHEEKVVVHNNEASNLGKAADENNNLTAEILSPGTSGKSHQCDLEPIVTSYLQNVKRTIECNLKVTNISKIDELDMYCDGVVIGDFVFKFCKGMRYITKNSETSKYFGIYTYVNYKGNETDWSIKCDIDTSFMSQKVNQYQKKSLSHTFSYGDSNFGWLALMKWADLVYPNNGLIVNDSLDIQAIIKT